MAGLISKAMAGFGTGLAQASLIQLQNQAAEARERRLMELRAESDTDLVEVADETSPTGTRLVKKKEAAGRPGKPGSKSDRKTYTTGTIPGTKDTLGQQDSDGQWHALPGQEGSGSRKTYGELGVIPNTNMLGQKDSDGQWHPLPNQEESMNDLVGEILGKVRRDEKITAAERDVLKIYQDFRLDPMSRMQGAAISGKPLDSANLDNMLEPYMQQEAPAPNPAPGDGSANTGGAAAAPRYTEGQTAVNDKGRRIIFSGGKWVPASWKDGGWKPSN